MRLSDFVEFGLTTGDVTFDFISPCLGEPPGSFLTFYEDEKFLDIILSNKMIKVVICTEDDVKKFASTSVECLISESPRLTFFLIQNRLCEAIELKNEKKIGENFEIGSNSIIYDDVIIGNNVRIGNNVVIYPNTVIGHDVVIRDGVIIGSDGFEVKRMGDKMLPVKHLGRTRIESGVELKEYVTVHKAVFNWDETIINRNTQIDSKTHISHGVKIHENVLIGAGTIILGNVVIGPESYIGAASLISNRIEVGKSATVTIGSIVTKNVPENIKVTGNFAIPHNVFMDSLKKW